MALLLVGASQSVLTECTTHCHDCYEIIVNTEGEGVAEIGDMEHPFSPGTIHVIPPHTPHKKTASAGFRDLFLHTDTLQPAGHTVKKPFAPERPILLADDASRTMEGLALILLNRYLINPDGDDVADMLLQIVLRLVESWSHKSPPDPVVNEVIHTITTSYSNPDFQVTDALLGTGYSKDHIRRRFHRETGMTPGEYLKSVRLSYARCLLKRKNMLHLSINEIALMCGFYDPSYFCRCFHRETGMTPSAFQKQLGGAL